MQKQIRKLRNVEKPALAWTLFVMLLCQFALLCYMNFTKTESFLDYDSSLAFRHATDMWKSGRIFFSNYHYMSSLEVDSVSFFAAPFYLLTGSLNIGVGIAQAFFFVVTSLVIYDLVGHAKKPFWCGSLACLLVMTPYAYGQLSYANMLLLSAGQYSVRVLTLLLLLNVLTEPKPKTAKARVLLFAYFFCLLLTSFSSGIYVLAMGIFPLLLWFGFHAVSEQRLDWKRREPRILILSCVLALAAAKFTAHFASLVNSTSLNLCPGEELYDNLLDCVVGVYLLCGGALETNQQVIATTFEGVAHIAEWVFCTILLFVVPAIVYRKKLHRHTPLFGMIFAIGALNFFVLSITKTRYGSGVCEYRYHIIWFVPMLIAFAVTAHGYLKTCQNAWLRKLVCIALAAFVAVANLQGFSDLSKVSALFPDSAKAVLSAAKEQNTNTILLCGTSPFIQTTGHVTRALDPDGLAFNFSLQEDGSYLPDFGDFCPEDMDALSLKGRSLLVMEPAEFETLPDYIRTAYTQTGTLGDYNFYATSATPFDFAGGPPLAREESFDQPTSLGYTYAQGTLNEDGTLGWDKNAKNGLALHGSQWFYANEVYRVTLDYEADEDISGTFRVLAMDGTVLLAETPLTAEGAVLENISVPTNQVLAIELDCDAKADITVRGIHFERTTVR